MVDERDLTPQEQALLLRILQGASFPCARDLIQQVPLTRVVGGIPTLLDLLTERSAPSANCKDGPIPIRVLVRSQREEPDGEILVWVRDGYLSGLEFAWFTEEPPAGMPPPETIHLGVD